MCQDVDDLETAVLVVAGTEAFDVTIFGIWRPIEEHGASLVQRHAFMRTNP